MKKKMFIWFVFFFASENILFAQENPVSAGYEQQLESVVNEDSPETEDDSHLQDLSYYQKHPLNLNTTGKNELEELQLLSDLQIDNLLMYREQLGKLISIYELQAIPAWDIVTIKNLLPYVIVSGSETLKESFRKRMNGGDHFFLFRYAAVLEKARGYNSGGSGSGYLGGRDRLFFRYKYQYKNLLQYGVTGDKDAGEQFFRGKQRYGFDFYSFHFFTRNTGIIKQLAIGDFTVNMGQGLIQWQSLAFKKSAEVMAIKREAQLIRPYNSAGEFFFNRGAGITLSQKKFDLTLFASLRKLSGNLVYDSVTGNKYVSSILTSGYHRTVSESEDRNDLRLFASGGSLRFSGSGWHIALNSVLFRYSTALNKKEEPYNLYAVSGTRWSNSSIDYAFTFRNIHFFGETAVDRHLNMATINGLLVSADPKIDVSFLYRNIEAGYQAVNGNAFTENAVPSNEKGFYAGIAIRPSEKILLNAYADIFQFPWLKYRTDAPSQGKDFLVQLTFNADKKTQLYTRYKIESKEYNDNTSGSVTEPLVLIPRQSWRTHLSFMANNALTINQRVEVVWFDKRAASSQTGFLAYTDLQYKPIRKYWSIGLRMQYFETDDYNSRIYAYENDVLYYFSIPAYYDHGLRYYFNISAALSKTIRFWVKFSQSLYIEKQSVGSGLDEINSPSRSELKLQLRIVL